MKTKKKSNNAVINFFRTDYKKIILGGGAIYFTAYIINLIYFFIMDRWGLLYAEKNLSITQEVTAGSLDRLYELIINNFNGGVFFGAATVTALFVILAAIIQDERLLLKKVSSWKEVLALGFSWALIFVVLENIMTSIVINKTSYPDGSWSGSPIGITTLNFYFYSYWYFVLILMLPVAVIAINKYIRKK